MTTFSPSEAAFEGFRVIRRHPGAVLAWAVAYVIVYMGLGALALGIFGSQFGAAGGQPVTPAQIMAAARSVGLGILVFFPLVLLIFAVFTNAVFRPVLRPADGGLFYLKISGDEWRLSLLFLAYFGLGLLAEILLITVVVVLALVAGGALNLGHAPPPPLLVIAGVLVIFCLAIWLIVRLSLAAPMTLATRRLSVFGSWRVTKGRFWALFGCYFLAWIFAVLITILGWVISVCVGAVINGDWTPLTDVMVNPRTAMMTSGFGMFSHMFTAAVIARVVISSLMGVVSRAIMYAPAAAAYRDLMLAGETPGSDTSPIRSAGLVL